MSGSEADDERRLDELLELAGRVEPPRNLARDVRHALAEARAERALDRLLDRLPEPCVPTGLAARVLAGLEGRRARARTLRAVLLGAAALLAVALGLLGLRMGWHASQPSREHEPTITRGTSGAQEPPAELLAALDALENWEILTSDDLDLLLAGLDVADEALLELQAQDAAESVVPEGGAPTKPPTKKG